MSRVSTTQPAGAPAAPPLRVDAIVGIVFAILFAASLVLVRIAVPADPRDPGVWLAEPGLRRWVELGLNLTPFVGLVFLWFMAGLRSRLGAREDQFFSTLFLGSGVLFVAMVFVAGALSRGALQTFEGERVDPLQSPTYLFARGTVYLFINIFAIKAAAMFMFVTSTIGRRTGLLPHGVALAGYAGGLLLLLIITDWPWIALVFPLWALLLSVQMLIEARQSQAVTARAPAEARLGGGAATD
jgi:hypothetical protein